MKLMGPTFRMAAAGTVLCLTLGLTSTAGATPPGDRTSVRPTPGYWLVGADGGVFAFNAPFYGSSTASASPLNACEFIPPPGGIADGCVGIAAVPNGLGYWLLNTARGAALPYGQAGPQPPSSACSTLNDPGLRVPGFNVGVASSNSGTGYWEVTGLGYVYGCGDVQPPLGGATSVPVGADVVGIAATPDGRGYWLVSSDGGVFAFGDAPFAGSMGGKALNAPIVGIAPTPDGNGYWLAAADGGVFSFGDAAFAGSMGGRTLNAPMVGIAANPNGSGYWTVANDGGVFSFGGAPFEGSMGGKALSAPIVGIAASPATNPAPGGVALAPGAPYTITGSGCTPGALVQVDLEAPTHATASLASQPSDSTGAFSITVNVPQLNSPTADLSAFCVSSNAEGFVQIDVPIRFTQ